jgi:anti-sigma factor RsiW
VTCRGTRKRLSAYRDDALSASDHRQVAEHFGTCAACREREASLTGALALLAELPRPRSGGSIAAGVLTRLELESRGAGLPLLFRPAAAARPFLLPALVPAVLVLAVILASAVRLDRDPRALAHGRGVADAWAVRPAWGTEANPALLAAGVSVPRARSGDRLPERVLATMGEGSLFLETVVARDGSVSAITLLDGDSGQAAPLIDALRHERFEPGRFRGRPVAVSVYRLISRMDVRVPTT